MERCVKKLLFSAYLRYLQGCPTPLGKGFLSRQVRRLGLVDYKVDGLRLDLNPCAVIDRELISGRSHDPFVKGVILEALAHGGTFVDVGANIGVFTLAASMLRDVIVYAFEPSPRELRRLYRNLATNEVTNVVVFPFALGRTSKQVELTLGGDDNPGNNSVVAHTDRRTAGKVTLCRCESFDSLFGAEAIQRVRVVKIDVEGFEMEVLLGMSDAISAMKSVTFVVEVTPSFLSKAGSSAEELYAFFARFGFQAVVGIQDDDQWNECFVRKSS